MKKVFGQTVRELKREVNKKVLKVSVIEQKILDATSNDPWGPHGSHLSDIAQASRNYNEYRVIMSVLWKRINDTGKNWRHVHKALTVLEYLVSHGSERVIDEIKEHAYQISTLGSFQYIDSSGRDQGSNIRRKSQNIVALVNDKSRIIEVRQKASSDRDNSGYGRERDQGPRDPDERYRERYGDEEYGGRKVNDYQFGSRDTGSIDEETMRSFDDDDNHYSSRTSAGRVEDFAQEERQMQGHNGDAPPPSYEEAIGKTQHSGLKKRSGEAQNESPEAASSSPSTGQGKEQVRTDEYDSHADKPSSPSFSTVQDIKHTMHSSFAQATNEEDGFSGFDPSNPFSDTPTASSSEMDLLGSFSAASPLDSLALTPLTSAAPMPSADQSNAAVGTSFATQSAAPTFAVQSFEDPFGDGPFKAIPQEEFSGQQQSISPASFLQSSSGDNAPPHQQVGKADEFPSIDFGDMLGGLSYSPNVSNSEQLSGSPAHLPSELSAASVSSVPVGLYAGSAAIASSPSGQSMQHADSQTPPSNLPQYATSSAPLSPELTGINGGSDPLDGLLPRTGTSSIVSSHTAQSGIYQNSQVANSNPLAKPGFLTHSPDANVATLSMLQPNIQEGSDPLYGLLPPPVPALFPTAEPAVNQAAHVTNSDHLLRGGLSAHNPPGADAVYQATQPAPSTTMHLNMQESGDPLEGLLPHTATPGLVSLHTSQPVAHQYMQSANWNLVQQPGFSTQASQLATASYQPTMHEAPRNASSHQGPLGQLPQAAPTLPHTAQPALSSNIKAAPLGKFSHASLLGPPDMQAALDTVVVPQTNTQPPKKFEPKSAVWADTLSRGLVDLNISGPKTNPLADIGVDFEAMNRKEKRYEVKSTAPQVTSTTAMGKAMGSGSGLGRAGATGFTPLLNPMMGSGMRMGGAGMGMGGGMGIGMPGFGGNMNPQIGAGMGMNMGTMGMAVGMNMGMGMNQGTSVRPSPGMRPSGPNIPGMGYDSTMSGYGSHQNFGG